ncbi:MAG: hypothetical protein KA764_21365, partial [Anaerolineales bacterium]|nr:hypothetical protein [Anaerolineales bacterium]
MLNSKLFRLLAPVAVLISLLTSSLACGSSTTEQLAEAAATPTAAEVQPAAENTPAPAAPLEAQPPATEAATDVPPSPTPEPQALQLAAQGFGQDGRQVGYAFIVTNPNPGLAIESSQFQVAFYNADGTVLETDSGYLELMLPGQKLGVGGVVFLDEGATAAKLEVQLSDGDPLATEPLPGFTVAAVQYY